MLIFVILKDRFEAVQIFYFIYPTSTHNFCGGPQPQRLAIANCRPRVSRPCYVKDHIRITASITLSLFLLHFYYSCFAVIFEEPSK